MNINPLINRLTIHRLTVALSLGAIASCASPKTSLDKVQAIVAGRTGQRVEWLRGGSEDAEVASAVRSLLHRELTANSAVQIALLNNRSLQARFEEIGISQADLVQAGLLSNPTFAASWRFPDRPPSATNVEYSLTTDFLDFLILPIRKRVAATQLARTETQVADEVLKLAAETKTAFYTLQAREQLLARLQVIAEANQTSVDFTKRLHEAGNASDLDLANQQGSYEQAHLDIAQATLQVSSDRERLNRLLGISDGNTPLKITEHLPQVPAEETSLRRLESLALSQRLDLEAARMNVNVIGQALALRTKTRYLPAGIKVGVDTESETDRQRVTGPTLDIELPIFNQGQGEIARLAAQYRQAQRELEAMTTNARSEVRETRAQLIAGRNVAFYIGKTLLPTRQQALALTLQQYNYMLKGAYDLLGAKQDEVAAERSYIEAWRDYWIARAELERAVGGNLSGRILSRHATNNQP